MAFTRRERVILLVTVAALGALVLDRFVLTPLWDWSGEVETRKALLATEMARAEGLLKRRRTVEPRWRRLTAEALKRDPGAAESQVLHALGRWAGETGLNLVSLQPERLTEETLLPEIDFRASGTGSMATVSRFLWRLETAEIPLRIKGLQLTSRKDGQDDLSLQLTFSTLYVPTDETDRPAAEGAVLVPPDPFGAGRTDAKSASAGAVPEEAGASRTAAEGEGP